MSRVLSRIGVTIQISLPRHVRKCNGQAEGRVASQLLAVIKSLIAYNKNSMKSIITMPVQKSLFDWGLADYRLEGTKGPRLQR
jgi:hypothetical protein